MIFKKIGKGLKKIAKGVKKIAKGVVKTVTSNDFLKVAAIAAATVFTAGAGAAAFGAMGSGWASALSSTPLIGTVFNAGAGAAAGLGLGQAATQAAGSIGQGSFGIGQGISGGLSGASTQGAIPSLTQAAGLATPGAASSGGGIISSAMASAPGSGFSAGQALGGAAKTVAGKIGGMSPTSMLLAGNALSSAFAPDEIDLLRERERMERSRDNRYGYNNLTGEGAPIDVSRLTNVAQSLRDSVNNRGLIGSVQ